MVASTVAVIDWSLPTLGAEKVIQILREQQAHMRIVACSRGETIDITKRAMAAGAAGISRTTNRRRNYWRV